MTLVFNKNKILKKIYSVVPIHVIKLKHALELLKALYIVIHEKL